MGLKSLNEYVNLVEIGFHRFFGFIQHLQLAGHALAAIFHYMAVTNLKQTNDILTLDVT